MSVNAAMRPSGELLRLYLQETSQEDAGNGKFLLGRQFELKYPCQGNRHDIKVSHGAHHARGRRDLHLRRRTSGQGLGRTPTAVAWMRHTVDEGNEGRDGIEYAYDNQAAPNHSLGRLGRTENAEIQGEERDFGEHGGHRV